MGSVKDLFDMKDICNVPGVFGEGPQRKSILPDKCRGRVWKTLLLGPHGYSLPETIKEDLGCVKDQRFRMSIKLVVHSLVYSLLLIMTAGTYWSRITGYLV